MVSTGSERTISTTVRVSTPLSPLHESSGAALTPIIITAVVSVAATVQESKTVPVAIDENLVVDTDIGIGVTQVEHAEVTVNEDPVQADVIPSSGIPVMEETLAQDPVDDIFMGDMADTHDSYDAVLAETEDRVAGTQAADLEVDAPVTTHTSPTKTCNWLFINILLSSYLMAEISCDA